MTILSVPPATRRSSFAWVPYVSLLRVQIIVGLLLVGLPLLALVPRPSPVLNGLFDLDYANELRTAAAMAMVASAAVAVGMTILVTAWVSIINAPSRFNLIRTSCKRFMRCRWTAPSLRPYCLCRPSGRTNISKPNGLLTEIISTIRM